MHICILYYCPRKYKTSLIRLFKYVTEKLENILNILYCPQMKFVMDTYHHHTTYHINNLK